MARKYVKLSEAVKARVILRREAREKAKNPPKNGRPRAEIDLEKVRKLAEIGCPDKEIAAVLGVSISTLKNRMKIEPELAEAIEQGRDLGKVSLRKLMVRHSEGEGGPAVNMTIHRAKHELGQFDKPTNTHSTVDINVEINSAGERISAKLDDLRRRMLTHQEMPQLEIIDVPVTECVESGVVEHAPDRGAESVPSEPDEGGAGGA